MQKHWEGYVNALSATPIPATSNTPVAQYKTSSSDLGVSGFLDMVPKNAEMQARYDAMSGSWAGVDASNKALSNGMFSTDAMPIQQNHPFNTTNVRGDRQPNANPPKSG